jgi:hypothetical protein
MPANLPQLLTATAAARAAGLPVHFLAGNTGAGIYKDQWQTLAASACIVVTRVPELQCIQVQQPAAGQTLVDQQSKDATAQSNWVKQGSSSSSSSDNGLQDRSVLLTAGAGITISRLLQVLKDTSAKKAAAGDQQGCHNLQYWVCHISRIAGEGFAGCCRRVACNLLWMFYRGMLLATELVTIVQHAACPRQPPTAQDDSCVVCLQERWCAMRLPWEAICTSLGSGSWKATCSPSSCQQVPVNIGAALCCNLPTPD